MRKPNSTGLPPAQGLYRPEFEHDSCGVGFVAHIKGKRSHQIIDRRRAPAVPHGPPRRVRLRAEHGRRRRHPHGAAARVSARSREAKLRRRRCRAPGKFAAGIVFLPTDAAERERCKAIVAAICAEQGQTLVGWRDVPTDADAADIGHGARAAAPHIEQLFIAAGDGFEGDAFERKLYLHPQAGQPPAARRHDADAGEACSTSAACRPR